MCEAPGKAPRTVGSIRCVALSEVRRTFEDSQRRFWGISQAGCARHFGRCHARWAAFGASHFGKCVARLKTVNDDVGVLAKLDVRGTSEGATHGGQHSVRRTFRSASHVWRWLNTNRGANQVGCATHLRKCAARSIYTNSTAIAVPPPVPWQSDANPSLPPSFCKPVSSVTIRRAPVQPMGWPRAMPPP